MVIHSKKKVEPEKISTLFGAVEVKKEETELPTRASVWDFVNSLSQDKNYMFDDSTSKEYTAFTINRAFSIHVDTLHHAMMMNQCYNLDKKMQHDYYYHVLPKKVRRKKWLKKTDEEKHEIKILEDVANVIQYNFVKTKSFWKTLTEAQRKDFLARYVYPDSKNDKLKQKNTK